MRNRLTERKIVLIRRRTRLDELLRRFNSVAQARFYIERLGADFSDYETEQQEYKLSVAGAYEILSGLGRVHQMDRSYLPNFLFGPEDIVVAVGQDGMVANTLKYLSGQPLLGVNPSPNRWDGVLLPFVAADLERIVPEVLADKRPLKEVTMGRVMLNDGQSLLAVNDFFVGQKTHLSARYRISLGDAKENQSSSGIIISTGLGATGWLASVLAGAGGIVNISANKKISIKASRNFTWDADYLYYSVREPFPSNTTGTSLVFGKVTSHKPLVIVSQMAENGVIFSDGIENDFLEFNSGKTATISLAERKGLLVV